MLRKFSRETVEIPVRDQPIPVAIGWRKMPRESIAPTRCR